MIGTLVHPAEPGDDLDAVDVGQPEVDDHEIGEPVGGPAEPLRAGVGEIDLEVAGPEVGGQRPQDLRLVVDHQHAGHASTASGRPTTIVTPATGRVLDGELAAHGIHEPLRHREPEADPAGAVAEALERLEDALSIRRSGCRGRGRRSGGRRGARRRPASIRTRPSGADAAMALAARLATARSSSAGRPAPSGASRRA